MVKTLPEDLVFEEDLFPDQTRHNPPSERLDHVPKDLDSNAFLRRKYSLDALLHDIFRVHDRNRRQSSVYESDTLSDAGTLSCAASSQGQYKIPTLKWRRHLLQNKSIGELKIMEKTLKRNLALLSSTLIKEVKKKDRFLHKFHKNCDVVTAILHALSHKTREDTRMRFSVEPFAGDSGFTQWHDAMKMCARLPGGIPPEFRRRMWLTLAEQHVRSQGIVWKEVERTCFNEWTNPDDQGLGDQIIKDLHRTGCSLFCGEDAEINQALLKKVLLGYARWNKSVGYCQGFNMLAAIILEVMDRQESDALKVMIYLIEGVLPESYFANNLRGLSVDMAVFRELMRVHLPELSRHLEALQHEASDQATGACYEPPLTNVFTMQWFLTLFSNCLPRDAVMRVWDLTFLQGNEVLIRAALAIWGRLSSRILEIPSADEFYCVMGDLTRQILAHGLMDSNQLVQTLIAMAPFPFPGLAALRDKYTYNITPWTQSVSSVARRGLKIFYLDDEEDDEKADDVNQTVAIATAFGLAGFFRKSSDPKPPPENFSASEQGPQDGQSVMQSSLDGVGSSLTSSSITRPNLDISALKKQYSRLRERQRQAHIIVSASNIRRKSIDEVNKLSSFQKTNQLTMKHLLRGKKALTTRTKRVVAQGVIPPLISKKKVERKLSDSTGVKKRSVGGGSTKSPKLSHKNTEPVINVECVPLTPKETKGVEGREKTPETLHWKDAMASRRARRASLPYGVKLMEISASPPLPEIKDDDVESSGNSSTSTELCDDDLAVLSEEDLPIIARPLSTSPRLENHDISAPKEILLESPVEIVTPTSLSSAILIPPSNINTISDTIDITEINEKIINGVSEPDEVLPDTLETVLDKKMSIPEISVPVNNTSDSDGPMSIGKASLSSPTKWKWSFSEIEDPSSIEPVSPILKLHNFLSEESLASDEASVFPTPSPKIINNCDSTLSESHSTEQERSGIFAYLFEITDVTKLSNVASQEPSPVDEIGLQTLPIDTTPLVDESIGEKDFIHQSSLELPVSNDFKQSTKQSEGCNVSKDLTESSNIRVNLGEKVEDCVKLDDSTRIAENKSQNKEEDSKSSIYFSNLENKILFNDSIKANNLVNTFPELIQSEKCTPKEEDSDDQIRNIKDFLQSDGEVQLPTKRIKTPDSSISCVFTQHGTVQVVDHYKNDSLLEYTSNLNLMHEKNSLDKMSDSNIVSETEFVASPEAQENVISKNQTHIQNEEPLTSGMKDFSGSTEKCPQDANEFLTHEESSTILSICSPKTTFEEETLIVTQTSQLDDLPTCLQKENSLTDILDVDKQQLNELKIPKSEEETPPPETESSILENKFSDLANIKDMDEKPLNEPKNHKSDQEIPSKNSVESVQENKISPLTSSDSITFNESEHSEYQENVKTEACIDSNGESKKKKISLVDTKIPIFYSLESSDRLSKCESLETIQSSRETENSPPDENASEVIRRKLWAGVKSLSLDADLLISTSKTKTNYHDFSSSFPSLAESPTNGNMADEEKIDSDDADNKTMSQKEINFRKSTAAALKLMKENTKIIDQILNQRYSDGNDNEFVISENDIGQSDPTTTTPLSFFTLEYLSDHQNSVSESGTKELMNYSGLMKSNILSIEKAGSLLTEDLCEKDERLLIHLQQGRLDDSSQNSKLSNVSEKTNFRTFDNKSTLQNLASGSVCEEEPTMDDSKKGNEVNLLAGTTDLDDKSKSKTLLSKNVPEINALKTSDDSPDPHTKKVIAVTETSPKKTDDRKILRENLKGAKSINCDRSQNFKANSTHPTSIPIVPFSKLSKLSPKTYYRKPRFELPSKNLLSERSMSFDMSTPAVKECLKITSTSCQTSPESSFPTSSITVPPRPVQTFVNPFPTKALDRKPKEVAIKLGLYNNNSKSPSPK